MVDFLQAVIIQICLYIYIWHYLVVAGDGQRNLTIYLDVHLSSVETFYLAPDLNVDSVRIDHQVLPTPTKRKLPPLVSILDILAYSNF